MRLRVSDSLADKEDFSMFRSGANLKLQVLLLVAVLAEECFMAALLFFSSFTEGAILGKALAFKILMLLIHWLPLIAGWRLIRQSALNSEPSGPVRKQIIGLLMTTYMTVGFVEIGLMLLLGHR